MNKYYVSKRETHQRDLRERLDVFLETGVTEGIWEYIVSQSNLPGPRANLELAGAFSDIMEEYAHKSPQRCWELCMAMIGVSAEEAPVNAPLEFVPFCGAVGTGRIGSVMPQFFEQALAALRSLARDPRWRMREAVCFGLQNLMAERGQDTLTELEGWIVDGDLLEMRAVAATVAEPSLLDNAETAQWALRLHTKILDQVLQAEERKSEGFRILRKALGYTLSVVVCAIPEEGFEFMARLAELQDSDVLWIVKENLKKNRLVKNFPQEVESMGIQI